jgi:hypothetical protein
MFLFVLLARRSRRNCTSASILWESFLCLFAPVPHDSGFGLFPQTEGFYTGWCVEELAVYLLSSHTCVLVGNKTRSLRFQGWSLDFRRIRFVRHGCGLPISHIYLCRCTGRTKASTFTVLLLLRLLTAHAHAYSSSENGSNTVYGSQNITGIPCHVVRDPCFCLYPLPLHDVLKRMYLCFTWPATYCITRLIMR